MENFLENILFATAICDIVFAVTMLLGERRKNRSNRLFAAYAIGGAVWSFCFGELITQESEEMAYLFRCIGMFGVFASLILLSILILGWVDMRRSLKRLIKIFALGFIVIYPFNIRRESVEFYRTSWGMSYTFKFDFFGLLYVVLTIILSLIYFAMVFKLISKKSSAKNKYIGKRVFVALGGLVLGNVFDTLLPSIGYTAIPLSTFFQFICTVCMFSLTKSVANSQLIEANAGKYIFHLVSTSVLIYDNNKVLVQASEEAVKFLGLEGKKGQQVLLSELFRIKEEELQFWESDQISFEAPARGNGRHCLVTLHIMRDVFGEKTGNLVIVSDATERHRIMEELQKERKRADEANNAKSEFLARVSHEIRTPINTILGMNEMIRRESLDRQILHYSSNIGSAGESLLSIINDILDVSKVEAGQMKIVCAEYETRLLFEGLIDMFAFRAAEKGLEFEADIDPKIPIRLYGDEVRVNQILVNLLSNAIKYTQQGKVRIKATGIMHDDICELRFVVSDTGIGIAEEDQKALFEPFARFDEEINRGIEGTGLGLSIVNSLCKLMNAGISIESKRGEGSTFEVRIDQKIVDPQAVGIISVTDGRERMGNDYRPSFTASGAYVLVVDDNRMNLEVIRGLLKRTKVNVDTVSSGNECIDIIRANRYDIVFIDHMMPGMDGIETLEKIKSLAPGENKSEKATYIMMTANALKGAREFYVAHGYDDYLSKPVEAGVLERMIASYLPQELLEDSSEAEETGTDDDDERIRACGEILKEYGIDIKKGLEYTADFEGYTNTARSYMESYNDEKKDLVKYRDSGDVGNYRILIHGIKSNARTLGYDELFEYAYSQEMACANGIFEGIISDGPRPEAYLDNLASAFTAAFGFDEADNDTPASGTLPITTDEIWEIRTRLIDLLENFEETRARELTEKLMTHDIGPENMRFASDIIKFLKRYDYDNALECANKLR
ncbi:MAG: response regulator [Lachnospiraceae bacterium]|nr:response regulator [Lachnospiraceae bacterium]